MLLPRITIFYIDIHSDFNSRTRYVITSYFQSDIISEKAVEIAVSVSDDLESNFSRTVQPKVTIVYGFIRSRPFHKLARYGVSGCFWSAANMTRILAISAKITPLARIWFSLTKNLNPVHSRVAHCSSYSIVGKNLGENCFLLVGLV